MVYAINHSNVNTAFPHAMTLLIHHGEKQETRNGPALVLPAPLVTTIRRPQERVLFHKARRANPFFHLFEAFWMLAGRRNSAFLDQYVHDFGARYAEDDGDLWGAYGYRWRHWFSGDQLDMTVALLKKDPLQRRVVIAMWDSILDLNMNKKDIPCNTHIYPRLHPKPDGRFILDLTVCNRSNDMIWGLFGANIVHFSVLLEYLAWRLNADVGALHILSNNAHVYQQTFDRFDPKEEPWNLYAEKSVQHKGLFLSETTISDGVFCDELDRWLGDTTNHEEYEYQFQVFNDLLVPMASAHKLYKEVSLPAAEEALQFVNYHTDWKAAAQMFFDHVREVRERREKENATRA